ncbi:hypothetical protein HWV62_7400 [Athelia sp. TMB]|nr:hypothetical protein HWV62_7400 [Athelia sp. TMB]
MSAAESLVPEHALPSRALTLALPFVSALTLSTPKDNAWSSGGSATVDWTSSSGDPSTFTLELSNTAFHNSYAIANNVNPSSGSISFSLPIVPAGAGYTVIAVAIGNISDVYATTGSFSVAAAPSSSAVSSSASASASGSASGSGSAGSSASSKSNKGSTSIPKVTYTPPATTSAFGHTVTTTPTGSGFGTTVTSTTPVVVASGSGSGSAAAPSISGSFNGASSVRAGFSAGSVAVVLLSAVAGMALAV